MLLMAARRSSADRSGYQTFKEFAKKQRRKTIAGEQTSERESFRLPGIYGAIKKKKKLKTNKGGEGEGGDASGNSHLLLVDEVLVFGL